jgi:hypothetical protein
MIYSAATKQYVLWMQLGSLASDKPHEAIAAVAVSESPAGPFRMAAVGTLPGPGAAGEEAVSGTAVQHRVRALAVTVDSAGKGWLVYASGSDGSGIALPLNRALTAPAEGPVDDSRVMEQLPGTPVLFQSGKTYYLLNGAGSCYTAKTPTGKWKEKPLAGVPLYPPAGVLPKRSEAGEIQTGQFFVLAEQSDCYRWQNTRYALLPLTTNRLLKTCTLQWHKTALPFVWPDLSLLWLGLGAAGTAAAAGGIAFAVLRRKKKRTTAEPAQPEPSGTE